MKRSKWDEKLAAHHAAVDGKPVRPKPQTPSDVTITVHEGYMEATKPSTFHTCRMLFSPVKETAQRVHDESNRPLNAWIIPQPDDTVRLSYFDRRPEVNDFVNVTKFTVSEALAEVAGVLL